MPYVYRSVFAKEQSAPSWFPYRVSLFGTSAGADPVSRPFPPTAPQIVLRYHTFPRLPPATHAAYTHVSIVCRNPLGVTQKERKGQCAGAQSPVRDIILGLGRATLAVGRFGPVVRPAAAALAAVAAL